MRGFTFTAKPDEFRQCSALFLPRQFRDQVKQDARCAPSDTYDFWHSGERYHLRLKAYVDAMSLRETKCTLRR